MTQLSTNYSSYIIHFFKALDTGKEVRVIFCDISKAFDRVWHAGLIHKLRAAGISGKLLDWFTNYLFKRRQRVVLPGVESLWTFIKAGVLQGSILGPLLFLIFINNIVNEIHANIRLFADDTSLYLIVEYPDVTAQLLNIDLETIAKLAKLWLVTFNPTKSESLIISRKVNAHIHPPIFLNNHQLTEVRYLEVFSPKMYKCLVEKYTFTIFAYEIFKVKMKNCK